MDLRKMKRAITKNTILVIYFLIYDFLIKIVGSCPNFPHGIIDPLEEMAAIAKQKNLLFHVDACLGSFCLPFANELG